MAGIKLYGTSYSGNCHKPKWILDRLGIAYDWIEVDALDGSTRTPEFLAINPAGQVPHSFSKTDACSRNRTR